MPLLHVWSHLTMLWLLPWFKIAAKTTVLDSWHVIGIIVKATISFFYHTPNLSLQQAQTSTTQKSAQNWASCETLTRFFAHACRWASLITKAMFRCAGVCAYSSTIVGVTVQICAVTLCCSTCHCMCALVRGKLSCLGQTDLSLLLAAPSSQHAEATRAQMKE